MNGAHLEWAHIGPEHCRGLQVFVCTDPPKPKKSRRTNWQPVHPRIYEYDAQQMIRSLAKEIPPRRGTHTLVGRDKRGIVAVCSWTELDGPGIVHLDVLGVAQRVRRPNVADAAARIGTEAMRQTLTCVEQNALDAGCGAMLALGEVYRENKASLHMVEHFGFTYVEEAPTGAQTWALEYALEIAT